MPKDNKYRSQAMLHLDIDAFFASVEQLRNPQLAGKPVAVGTGCIASCSYEARRYGLHAGMGFSEAERRCPELIVVAGHQAIYRCYSDQLFEICKRWSPSVETHLDEAFCDLSGTQGIYPDLWQLGQEMRKQVLDETGLRISIGIGRNRMFARLAGKLAKPDGLRIFAPAEEAKLLASLRVEQLPGVGPKTAKLLHGLNIETVPQLQQTAVPVLIAMLGKNGRSIHERSHGQDYRSIKTSELPKTISRETTFHQPTANHDEIDAMLQYLLERASRSLRERGLEAQGISLKITYSDYRRCQARHRLQIATALDSKFLFHARALLASQYQRRVHLRLVGITFDSIRLAPELHQTELFVDQDSVSTKYASTPSVSTPSVSTPSAPDEAKLLKSLDLIRNLHGHSAIVNGRSMVLLAPKKPGAGTRPNRESQEQEVISHLRQDRNGFILRTPSLNR